MPLASGTRLGPYEVVGQLGAGGMGEVYKARDTRLERTVAIKILSEVLSRDPQFRDRFEREARVISQLDHPHICALYDVGEDAGTSYLVMQFLEGETLASALAQGPLPVATALKVADEIAGALDRAHRAGVVHRDLKPGNVMLTRSGAKLLDFGLAKMSAATVSAVSAVPTTPPNLTGPGTVLGTFQYMAPEQVEGHDADPRTDIFAFGALLFEMFTGKAAFHGRTHASLIGSILRDEPPSVSDVVPLVPPAVSRVIKTCLAKDPDDRFQTMHDVALQLRWAIEGGSQAGVPVPVAKRRRVRERASWAVAAAALLAAAVLGIAALRRPEPVRRVVRFEVPVSEGLISVDTPRLSPDGQFIAFNATDSTGVARVWLRQMDALTARPVPGTEGAARPFWSPDSRFIGFMAGGKLMKVAVAGGPAQKICDAPSGADGSWSTGGVILYDGRGSDPIYRVDAGGGTPVVAVRSEPASGDILVGWPEFLPDGRHFLYLAQNSSPDKSAYRIGSLDSTESQPLASGQTQIVYSPTGHLLFVRDGTLMAQRFDAAALKTTGDPVPLAEKIGTDSVGLARFSVSRDGTLVYRTGEAGGRLLWADRAGREGDSIGEPGQYANPTVSPDGRRVAYDVADPRGGKVDIWIRDLTRGVSSRLTFGAGTNSAPVWSPDGTTIVFASTRDSRTGPDLYAKPTSGQGAETLLFDDEAPKIATDWSRDGRYIAFTSGGGGAAQSLWVLPTFGDKKPMKVAGGDFGAAGGVFSPDGRYIAYRSNESGRNEIYVQPFPDATGKWQISSGGGVDPSWRSDGKELYFRALDQKLMAVDIDARQAFQAATPRVLFQANLQTAGASRNRYSPAAAGDRFLLFAPLSRDAIAPTTVVLNWDAALSR